MSKFNITVQLVGTDGNAYALLGRVKHALQGGGVSVEEVSSFLAEAMSGDYNHLLNTCSEWVEVT